MSGFSGDFLRRRRDEVVTQFSLQRLRANLKLAIACVSWGALPDGCGIRPRGKRFAVVCLVLYGDVLEQSCCWDKGAILSADGG